MEFNRSLMMVAEVLVMRVVVMELSMLSAGQKYSINNSRGYARMKSYQITREKIVLLNN